MHLLFCLHLGQQITLHSCDWVAEKVQHAYLSLDGFYTAYVI